MAFDPKQATKACPTQDYFAVGGRDKPVDWVVQVIRKVS